MVRRVHLLIDYGASPAPLFRNFEDEGMLGKLENFVEFDFLRITIKLTVWAVKFLLSLALILSIMNVCLKIYYGYPYLNKVILDIISGSLSIFVLIELIKEIKDFIAVKRMRITPVIDFTIIFILREITVNLYHHDVKNIIPFSVSVLLLVICRVASIAFSPGNNFLHKTKQKEKEVQNV